MKTQTNEPHVLIHFNSFGEDDQWFLIPGDVYKTYQEYLDDVAGQYIDIDEDCKALAFLEVAVAEEGYRECYVERESFNEVMQFFGVLRPYAVEVDLFASPHPIVRVIETGRAP